MFIIKFESLIPINQYDSTWTDGIAYKCMGCSWEVVSIDEVNDYLKACVKISVKAISDSFVNPMDIKYYFREYNVSLDSIEVFEQPHANMKFCSVGTKTVVSDNKQFFNKIVVNGPATIGFRNGKKYVIKRFDGDIDDPEKALLMLVVKSKFGSDQEFHSWLKTNMKQMTAAYDLAASKSKKTKDLKIDSDKQESTSIPEDEHTNTAFISGEEKCYSRRVELSDFKRCQSCELIDKCPANTDSRCTSNVALSDQNGAYYTWTDSETDYLYKNYKTKSTKEMASDLGRSIGSVAGKLKRLKLTVDMGKISRKLSKQKVDEIIELYESGEWTRAQMSELTGICRNTINSCIFRLKQKGLLE